MKVFITTLLYSAAHHTSTTQSYFLVTHCAKCKPTVWLSGSGGTGETRMNDRAISGKPRSAKKRRSRCPLQPVLGRLALITEPTTSQESARERRALKACWQSAKDTAEPENNYGTKAGKKRRQESRLATRRLADLHGPNLAITLAGKPSRPHKQPAAPLQPKRNRPEIGGNSRLFCRPGNPPKKCLLANTAWRKGDFAGKTTTPRDAFWQNWLSGEATSPQKAAGLLLAQTPRPKDPKAITALRGPPPRRQRTEPCWPGTEQTKSEKKCQAA